MKKLILLLTCASICATACKQKTTQTENQTQEQTTDLQNNEMEDTKLCQSCGMPLNSNEVRGTEVDGSLSQDYCVYCYKDGKFTSDLTMEEMIENNLNYLDEFNNDYDKKFSKDEARAEMQKFFPTLNRWKEK
jgi:uncharacterized lipoprotein YddW (UPF0748 family)